MAFVILLFIADCCADGQSRRDEVRVLFIGNSLTYYNKLPEIVEAFAKSRKLKIRIKSVAEPNFGLVDHWNNDATHKLIAREKWDFVVLQQGPSASAEGRAYLLEYAVRFAKEIVKAGAKPAMYMVWPEEIRKQDFAGVSESYTLAARKIDGILLPAGEAWREAWRNDPKLDLYSADRFHPAVEGSYLAALVIFQRLFGESPIGLPRKLHLRSGETINLSDEHARALQEAAAKTNLAFGFGQKE